MITACQDGRGCRANQLKQSRSGSRQMLFSLRQASGPYFWKGVARLPARLHGLGDIGEGEIKDIEVLLHTLLMRRFGYGHDAGLLVKHGLFLFIYTDNFLDLIHLLLELVDSAEGEKIGGAKGDDY